MKAPKTTEEFKILLFSMEHRERLLFQTINGDMLECYFTIVSDFKNMFCPKFNDNFNFKVYKNYNGKTEAIIFNKSCYTRLATDDFLNSIFKLIEQDKTDPMRSKKIINIRLKNSKY